MSKFACPCCGKRTLDELHAYDVCGYCGWEDDSYPGCDTSNYETGANGALNLLSEGKARVAQGKNVVDGGALPWQSDYAGNSPLTAPRNVANTARRP
jgi:hypothetical protein